MAPDSQIDTKTKTWPRKLSLKINIAGGFHPRSVCVCIVFDSGFVSPSGNTLVLVSCFNWGYAFCVNSHIAPREQTHSYTDEDLHIHSERYCTLRQFLFPLSIRRTYRVIEQSSSALKIETLRKSEQEGLGGDKTSVDKRLEKREGNVMASRQ